DRRLLAAEGRLLRAQLGLLRTELRLHGAQLGLLGAELGLLMTELANRGEQLVDAREERRVAHHPLLAAAAHPQEPLAMVLQAAGDRDVVAAAAHRRAFRVVEVDPGVELFAVAA